MLWSYSSVLVTILAMPGATSSVRSPSMVRSPVRSFLFLVAMPGVFRSLGCHGPAADRAAGAGAARAALAACGTAGGRSDMLGPCVKSTVWKM